ncbi:peptide chain release factor N(5)-glutamine methyltransferase [bacterium]|nr:peptide chain release factor N(5)-glutamine methyltransferase [bacterium]MBU1983381.1 peptide chain release factor N(5)-glutamine methyltransferase [bacterium]
MTERVWTVAEILKTTACYLEEKGAEGARRSAELLLGKVLALPRIELYLQHDRPLTEDEVAALRRLVQRRARREPLQYILGEVDFCGLTIEVSPGLLIPRPETEELALFAARTLGAINNRPLRALDIGTGTGCLAVAMAVQVADLSVDAVDVDFEACTCAHRNAAHHGVGNRVRVFHADLFSPRFMSKIESPYDAIVANPPYVTAAEHRDLMPEVRGHESRRALVAGANGLAFYHRIAELLPELLKPEGRFAIEIGHGQEQAVAAIMGEVSHSIEVRADISGIPRIVSGLRL